MIEIKNCQCGTTAKVHSYNLGDFPKKFRVKCDVCLMQTDTKFSQDEVVECWNTRVNDQKLKEIEKGLHAYFRALDERQHGGVAADNLVRKVQEVFDQYWRQGISKNLPR